MPVIDVHVSWVGVAGEFLPPRAPLRRYRVGREAIALQARRRMAREIRRQIHPTTARR